MYLTCVFIVSILVSSMGFEFEGDKARISEPLTRHKSVRCFDENVKIHGPKSFEVEKHNKKEDTKMSILRLKRRAGCTVKTVVTDDESDDLHGLRHHHHHHHHHPPPKNFRTKTSYSVSKSVTSPPVEHNFNTRHSSSSDSEISSHDIIADHRDGYSSVEELPTIPHLPAIPHIGHEATYPNHRVGVDLPIGNGNARETDFGGEEPGPGEKTITFKTNTHRHEMVDQTGFVREKANGYPVRPNDDWRARFKDMPHLVDENGKVMSSAAGSSLQFRFIGQKFSLVFLLVVSYALSIFLVS